MTIEKVESEPSVESKPAAIPARIPLGTILGDMADAMDGAKKDFERYKKVSVLKPLIEVRDQVREETEERLEVLQQVAEAKENQGLWSFGHMISAAGYGGLSIIFGTYLMASGEQDQGRNLIVGGSALLANSLMDYLGGWTLFSELVSLGNATVEQTLKVTLPLATTLMAFIYGPHNLVNLPFEHRLVAQYLDKMMSWINMLVQVGNVYASWMLGQAQRALTVVEGKITATNMRIQPLNLRNESLTNLAKQTNDAMKGGIKKMMNGTSAIPAV